MVAMVSEVVAVVFQVVPRVWLGGCGMFALVSSVLAGLLLVAVLWLLWWCGWSS